jgi:molecular chaperone DnaK (HSP70)
MPVWTAQRPFCLGVWRKAIAKVSPVAASASYLAHLRTAWNRCFPQQLLERQELVLTVPASFDEAARALTVEAAHLAGLPQLRLLEEPQAACYDWLHRHHGQWAALLGESRLLLVCDVGGGTTDLTLIQIASGESEPATDPDRRGRSLNAGRR